MIDLDAPVIMTRPIHMGDANGSGNLFGGTLMGWMDEVCGTAAHRFARTRVTTAAVKQINFLLPIPYGSLLQLEAKVVRVGRTSMEVEVVAWMEQRDLAEPPLRAADGLLIFCSLGKDGRPQKIERKLEK